VQIDYIAYYSKSGKLEDERGMAQVTWPTFKSWDPAISLERLKLQTLNLASR